MIIEFGSIVLTQFPFTDLSGSKRRPAMVIGKDYSDNTDILLAYLTLVEQHSSTAVEIMPSRNNGLKVRSWVLMRKLATIDKTLVVGKTGVLETDYFSALCHAFRESIGAPLMGENQ